MELHIKLIDIKELGMFLVKKVLFSQGIGIHDCRCLFSWETLLCFSKYVASRHGEQKYEKKASVYNIKLLDCYSDSAWAYMFVCFPHITDDLHVSHKKVSFITLMLVLDFYCFY